jgi:hypothetical protein
MLGVGLDGSKGSGLLTLDAPSIQSDPDGSRQIVWMIKQSANSTEPVGSSVPAETEDIGGQPDIRPPRGTLAGRSRTRRLIP